MEQIDYNNDGDVNFEEFIILLVKQLKTAEDQEEELVEVFKQFDVGADGKITAEDLMLRFEQLKDPQSKEFCNEVLRITDKDGDGCLNFAEFVKVMLYNPNDKDIFLSWINLSKSVYWGTHS